MNNKRKKEVWIQLIAGLLTFVLGCVTCAYGYCTIVGKIDGNIAVCLLLLAVCFVSIIICVVLKLNNIKRARKWMRSKGKRQCK